MNQNTATPLNSIVRRILPLALFLGLASASTAQLKAKAKCSDFYIDILNGSVNEIKPNNTANEIKEKFPCFTSVEEDDANSKCGGAIHFKDKDIIFFTRRHYVEVGPKFIGRTSFPLLGARRGSLFKTLGNPKVKDDLWEGYEMQYGTLVLHYDVAGPNGKVKSFQFSTESTETIQLCE
jgi:hypothetical protein